MLSIDIIKKRYSCRTYDPRPLEKEDVDALSALIPSETTGLFGNRLRFCLLDLGQSERDELKNLGTYGFIKGAKLFLAGTVSMGHRDMLDFGYAMERYILEATSLGLGTCWLGGTFNKSGFSKKIGIQPGERLAALTPLGYPADRRTIREGMIRFLVKADNRKAWSELFFDGSREKSLSEVSAGFYRTALECVRLGPSASNKQPWRFIREDDRAFSLFLERTPGYAKKWGGSDLQMIDMGVAMCHFEVAAGELNLLGGWEQKPPAVVPEQWEYIASWIMR